MEKYIMVVSLKYENIGRTIAENGDFKRHSFNRLYVFNTARQILASKTPTEAKNTQLHFCALCPEYFPAYENIYNEVAWN